MRRGVGKVLAAVVLVAAMVPRLRGLAASGLTNYGAIGLTRLALAALPQDDPERMRVRAFFQEAMSAGSGSTSTMRLLAFVDLLEGRGQEALELYASYAPEGSLSVLDWYQLGRAQALAGDRVGQIDAWRKAGYLQGLLDVEALCRGEGDLLCTRQAAEAAIATDPHEVWGYLHLGAAYDAWGDPVTARAWYARAMEVAPASAFPAMLMGWSYANEGDLESAEAWYQRSIEIDPSAAHPHYEYGVLLWRLGDRDGARLEMGMAVALLPAYGYQLRIADLFLREGLPCDAAQLYLDWLLIDPRSTEAQARAVEAESACEAADGSMPESPWMPRDPR